MEIQYKIKIGNLDMYLYLNSRTLLTCRFCYFLFRQDFLFCAALDTSSVSYFRGKISGQDSKYPTSFVRYLYQTCLQLRDNHGFLHELELLSKMDNAFALHGGDGPVRLCVVCRDQRPQRSRKLQVNSFHVDLVLLKVLLTLVVKFCDTFKTPFQLTGFCRKVVILWCSKQIYRNFITFISPILVTVISDF